MPARNTMDLFSKGEVSFAAFCTQEGWSFLQRLRLSETVIAGGCKQPPGNAKLPPPRARGSLEPQAGETTASARKQSCLHRPKTDGCLWPRAGCSLPIRGDRAPVCPLLARPFPNRSASQLAGSLGQLPLPRACGEHGKHPLPAPLPAPDGTRGIWPVPVCPGCSSGESSHGIKAHTGMEESCTEANKDRSCSCSIV